MPRNLKGNSSGCRAEGGLTCGLSATRGLSQAGLLRELALAREQALGRGQRTGTTRAWHVVTLAPVDGDRADSEVRARVADDRGPMSGVTLYFHRAPHSGCAAKSLASGVASCHLVDQHGDDDAHAQDEAVAVLVTYPGDVGIERTLLPAMLVMRPLR